LVPKVTNHQKINMTKQFGFWALKLSAVITFIFIITILYPEIKSEYSLISSIAPERPWTLVTHIFLHSGFLHLWSNLFGLAVFGSILEFYIGSKKFLFLFFLAGIFAGVASIFIYNSVIGASGAIFGLLGTLAVIRPKQVVWVLGVPMYMVAAAFVWAALDFIGLFNSGNIANAAHLVGLGVGIIAGLEMRARIPRHVKQKKGEIGFSKKYFDKWEHRWMDR